MAEDLFKNILFAFIFTSLFGLLFLTAVVTVANDYEIDTSEVVGGALSLEKFNQSVANIETDAKQLQSTFEKGSIWSVIAGIVVEGIFGIAKTMIGLILAPFSLLNNIMIDVFGVPAWVTSVVLGVLIMSLIFGVWRLIKIGD